MDPKELMDRIQKLETHVKKINESADLMLFLLQAKRMLEDCKALEQVEEVLKELLRKHRREAHRTEDLEKFFDCALCETIITIQ